MFLHRAFVSSLCIQKWKENVRTTEVLVKQGCNESIKNRKEKKNQLFLELGSCMFSLTPSSAVDHLGSACSLPNMQTWCGPLEPWVSTLPLEFTCQEVRGHLEEAMTFWYEDRLPKLLQSFFFFLVPFFSLPFCLPLA